MRTHALNLLLMGATACSLAPYEAAPAHTDDLAEAAPTAPDAEHVEEDVPAAPDAADPVGPSNTWPHADATQVPADLAGTGRRTGDTAHDFTLVDQNGDEVSLYQFYGKTIVLDILAAWCGPCQDEAPRGQHTWETLRDQDLMYISVMEAADSGAPSAAHAARWADSFGLTHPVLADPDMLLDRYVREGYPTYVVIGPDMTILEEDLWPISHQAIENLLP